MENVFVLFEVTIKKYKMDVYLQLATSLKKELAKAEGCIRSERFSSLVEEGKLLSLSVWESEECVTQWRNLAMHRICQQKGRAIAFADYSITVLAPVRGYTKTDRRNAPEDSNQFLKG